MYFQLVLFLELQSTEDAGDLPLWPPLAVLLDVDPPLLLVAALLATVQTHRGGDDLVELGGNKQAQKLVRPTAHGLVRASCSSNLKFWPVLGSLE